MWSQFSRNKWGVILIACTSHDCCEMKRRHMETVVKSADLESSAPQK